MEQETAPSISFFLKAALGKKAFDPIVLQVGALTSIADTFIVCSGKSNRQVTAIAEHIRETLKKEGIHPLHVEGLKEGHWVLLDYGYVIIHVFYEPVRGFYDIEGLWADAPRLRIEEFIDLELYPDADGTRLTD